MRVRAMVVLKNKEQKDYIDRAVASKNKDGIDRRDSFSSFLVGSALAAAKKILGDGDTDGAE